MTNWPPPFQIVTALAIAGTLKFNPETDFLTGRWQEVRAGGLQMRMSFLER